MYENRLAYGPRPGCMLSTITTGLPPLTQKPECGGSGGIWQINDTCLAIDRFRSAEYRLNTEENIQDCTGRLISRRFYQFFHLFPIYPQLPKVLVLCPNGGICPKRPPQYMDTLDAEPGMFFCYWHDVANSEIQVDGDSAAYDIRLHHVVFFLDEMRQTFARPGNRNRDVGGL